MELISSDEPIVVELSDELDHDARKECFQEASEETRGGVVIKRIEELNDDANVCPRCMFDAGWY